jgi:hypothetical protein
MLPNNPLRKANQVTDFTHLQHGAMTYSVYNKHIKTNISMNDGHGTSCDSGVMTIEMLMVLDCSIIGAGFCIVTDRRRIVHIIDTPRIVFA